MVFALSLLFAVGFRALSGQVAHGGSALHSVTNLIGTGVSGGFLLIIAAVNLAILPGIAPDVRRDPIGPVQRGGARAAARTTAER